MVYRASSLVAASVPGSSLEGRNAGNSSRVFGLLHGAPKGVK